MGRSRRLRSWSRITGAELIDPLDKDLNFVIPLALLSVGEEGEIVEIRGGRGMVQRLSEMGFTNSTRVKVLSSSSPGPVLVGVRDARIALGRGIAMKIMVNTGGKR